MQRIEIFKIDAFTDKVFHGNPAAICLLKSWLNDELLQAIAVENNLSETAFIVEEKDGFQIRWFTPKGELSLGGHATLAAGFLLFELGRTSTDTVHFSSLSGELTVQKKADRVTINFPRFKVYPIEIPELLTNILNVPCLGVYESELDYLVLLENENQVLKAQVDLRRLEKLSKRGLILTSSSNDVDFYSRCFYPRHNILEDPVTGSAHSILASFWSEKLDKKQLKATQGSARKGQIFCEVIEDRVHVSGSCRWYSKGYLMI